MTLTAGPIIATAMMILLGVCLLLWSAYGFAACHYENIPQLKRFTVLAIPLAILVLTGGVRSHYH